MAKQVFGKVSMLKHICFANEKTKAEKHRMISLKCEKYDFVPNTLGRFFIMQNIETAHPIQFSAEIMVKRATWRIVECMHFLH